MKKSKISLMGIVVSFFFIACSEKYEFPYQNPDLSIDERVDDLVSRMTLEEKVSQMQNEAPAIERLYIPAYNWWNECLHGVGRSGDKVTVFPQAIALAAAFDEEAMEKMGDIVSTEARAIYNEALREGKEGLQYKGLTFWTPNINIFRDPRWGRGQETYGEDPYLTGLLGKAIVRGLEGTDKEFLKVSACAKHFAVHSGPEVGRHEFDANVTPYDLWDTYLPAFRDLVVDANVSSVMCAYNRFEGQPCCGNDKLMMDILRNKWGFTGYVTSDCGAIDDFYKHHKTHKDAAESAGDAVLHGTDLDCGVVYAALLDAVKQGYLTEADIDVSVKRLFKIRFRLGMFEPEGKGIYTSISYDTLECREHKDHALKMARQSMVLLKNKENILPLSQSLKKIAVIGPNADDGEVMLGNYNGFPSVLVTPLEAIKNKTQAEVVYAKGVNYTTADPEQKAEAYKAMDGADLVIFIGGISPRLEGEEGDAGQDKLIGFHGGDRTSIALPAVQTELMKDIKKKNIPLVFVNMSGSAVGFEWEAQHADAILQAWYGGQSGGVAIADILWGDYNPSGRLPVTFYRNDGDLPDFLNYDMANRTYRYFTGETLYPFGFGLSYTSFGYSDMTVPTELGTDENLTVSVDVTNNGSKEGDEVAQLYVKNPGKDSLQPLMSLKGIKRVHLAPGETKKITFTVSPSQLAVTTESGEKILESGDIKVFVGGTQPKAEEWESASSGFRIKGNKVQFN